MEKLWKITFLALKNYSMIYFTATLKQILPSSGSLAPLTTRQVLD